MYTENYLEEYYNNYDEEGRLLRRYGQVEYITTMKYIQKLLVEVENEEQKDKSEEQKDKKEEQKGKKKDQEDKKEDQNHKRNYRILEVGAGTGRYSIPLAEEGYQVDSVELVEHNLNILKSKIKADYSITASQGNALDLSAYADGTFDMTLVLGPMYHLYTEEDKKQALREAIRVTKTKGHILVAYCMNDATVLQFCFIENQIRECMNKNMITEDFHCISKPEDLFELVRTEDIKKLTEGMGVTRIHLVATDGAANYIREAIDNMDEELYELYLKYHLSTCEREDLIGASNHSLDILRKE